MFHFDDEDDVSSATAGPPRYTALPKKPARDPRLMTSEGRFAVRIEQWEEKKGSALGHHFWWFVHNAIAHPMIAVLPIKQTFAFHDYTSDRINCK